MKLNKNETNNFVKMMEWASKEKSIKKFSVYVQNNSIFICCLKIGGKVIQGNGKTLAEAMNGYMRSQQMILSAQEILDVQKGS